MQRVHAAKVKPKTRLARAPSTSPGVRNIACARLRHYRVNAGAALAHRPRLISTGIMQRFEAGLLCWLICAATMLLPPCAPNADNQNRYGEDCDLDIVDYTCGLNGRCKQESDKTGAKCTCQQGYEYINRKCTKMLSTEAPALRTNTIKSDSSLNSSEGGNSVAVILLIPTCLIVIGALAYFGARRYKWVQRFRQFRQNRYGSVLVTRDDTDDDDPPIA